MLNASCAQTKKLTSIQWELPAELPAIYGQKKALGLAGPVVGVIKNILIIAGGANFPDSMPWKGGKKKYYQDIYMLGKNDENKFSWLDAKSVFLKQGLAYSGNITTPEGIVCIGGETANGHTDEVFLLQWNSSTNNIFRKDLPALPAKLANTAVAYIGKTIYVAGGEDGRNAANTFFELDMSDSIPRWKSLPSLPIALSHAVGVAQFNGKTTCMYVIGGRSKTASGLSDLHNTVFCYDPVSMEWKEGSQVKDDKGPTNISAATALPFGETEILLIGGDKGNIFHQIETLNLNIASANTQEKQRLEDQKVRLLNDHPGFSKDVLSYSTVTDSWEKIGELPGLTPVTTTAVLWNNDIFIPSGEVKPGRRSAGIWRGRIISRNE